MEMLLSSNLTAIPVFIADFCEIFEVCSQLYWKEKVNCEIHNLLINQKPNM
jgi:hypothetical protein